MASKFQNCFLETVIVIVFGVILLPIILDGNNCIFREDNMILLNNLDLI